MPPVVDDEYGLEKAIKPEDEYGLESAKAPAPAAAAPKPDQNPNLPGATPQLLAAVKAGKAPSTWSQPTSNIEKKGEHSVFAEHPIAANIARSGATLGGMIPESTHRADYSLIPGIKQMVTHPIQSIEDVGGGMIDAQKERLQKGQEASEIADLHAAAGHPFQAANSGINSGLYTAEGLIPAIGPWVGGLADEMEEGIREKDPGKIAHAASSAGIGGLVSKLDMVPNGKPGLISGIGEKMLKGTPLTEEGRIAAAKEQALIVKKPAMKETQYSAKINEAMPDLQKIAQDNKGQIKTPRNAVEAIEGRVSQIEDPIRTQLESLPDVPENRIHPDELASRVNKAIDDHIAEPTTDHYSEAEIEKAREKVHELIGDKERSPVELERIRRRLNKDSSDYYKDRGAGRIPTVATDAEASFKAAAADAIREIQYGTETEPGLLEKAGVKAIDSQGNPVDLRTVRKQVGNLLEIRNHFRDAITKAENTGDWSLFNTMRTGPSLAAGGLGALLGGLAGGPIGTGLGVVGGELAKGWGDYLKSKNPNLNTQKMFRNLERTGTPNVSEIQAGQPVPLRPMAPPVPPAATQMPLNLPPQEAPLFNIQQTPKLRPDFEESRIPPIQGEQRDLNLPSESAPLFNINTPNPAGRVPELPKIGGIQDIAGMKGMAQEPGIEQGAIPRIEAPAPIVQPPAVQLPHPEPAELKEGESTEAKFYDPEKDQWSPEREANHQAVVDAALEGKTPPQGRPPEAIITVGGTASGKTTLTRRLVGADPNRVNIDSDANKLTIPEYAGLKKTDPANAAARVHEESSKISKQTVQAAVNKGLDLIYDTSTGGGGDTLFKKLKDLGYRVKLVYADIPVEEALQRSKTRAQSSADPTNRGRIVPEEVVREKHQAAADAFKRYQNSPNVDEIRGYDTTTREPKEFWNRLGNTEKVFDQKTLDRVHAKAAEPKPAGKS